MLCIPVNAKWLSSLSNELLSIAVPSVLRGVIRNSVSEEHGNVLGYWAHRAAGQVVDRTVRMIQVDEAFELLVPVFADYIDQLKYFREFDNLFTELIRFDLVDDSITVRISND